MTWIELYGFMKKMSLEQLEGEVVCLEDDVVVARVTGARMSGTVLDGAGVDTRAGLDIESLEVDNVFFMLSGKCASCGGDRMMHMKRGPEGWEGVTVCEGCSEEGA